MDVDEDDQLHISAILVIMQPPLMSLNYSNTVLG
jgi:hypothetical protein